MFYRLKINCGLDPEIAELIVTDLDGRQVTTIGSLLSLGSMEKEAVKMLFPYLDFRQTVRIG